MPTITNVKLQKLKADQKLLQGFLRGRVWIDYQNALEKSRKRGLTIALLASTQIVTLFILFF